MVRSHTILNAGCFDMKNNLVILSILLFLSACCTKERHTQVDLSKPLFDSIPDNVGTEVSVTSIDLIIQGYNNGYIDGINSAIEAINDGVITNEYLLLKRKQDSLIFSSLMYTATK